MKTASLLLALPLLCAAGSAYTEVEIREWPVPWEESRPRDPYVDGQGRVEVRRTSVCVVDALMLSWLLRNHLWGAAIRRGG